MLPGSLTCIGEDPVDCVGQGAGVLVCRDRAGIRTFGVGFWVGECGACGDCESTPGCYLAEEVAEFEAVYLVSLMLSTYVVRIKSSGVLSSYVSNAPAQRLGQTYHGSQPPFPQMITGSFRSEPKSSRLDCNGW